MSESNKFTGSHAKIFKVLKPTGPWTVTNPPTRFSEAQFVKHYALSKRAADDPRIDPDTYHTDLLGRLLKLGVIEHDKDASQKPDDIPLGVETAARNAGIASAVAEHDATRRNLNMVAANDAAAKSADNDQVVAPANINTDMARPGQPNSVAPPVNQPKPNTPAARK